MMFKQPVFLGNLGIRLYGGVLSQNHAHTKHEQRNVA